ncbi:hypothetical protein PR202_gb23972 [Eleusine coracana subsp. coracana]|uniref:Membrane magnesium transporter n=1 Tax=Eleusine coracana subsp. coracana TaxID=191504 RepID=A0AAV5FK23_ELECO|nr:hypothetical protein PR202_gb23972 [Eleusine coracana subsp. coracana]
MGIGYVVGVLGGAILAHAAYATIQYRAVLKITEEEFSGPPMDVRYFTLTKLLSALSTDYIGGLTIR